MAENNKEEKVRNKAGLVIGPSPAFAAELFGKDASGREHPHAEEARRVIRAFEAGYIDTTNDVIFKHVFGREENKAITIAFLNAVLQERLGTKIQDLVFAPPEQVPLHQGGKTVIYDLAVMLDTGAFVDIEIQVCNKKDTIDRMLSYWSYAHASRTKRGDAYDRIPETICVSVLGYDYFTGHDRYCTYHGLCDLDSKEQTSKKMLLCVLELPKFFRELQKVRGELSALQQWLCFFSPQVTAKEKEEVAKMNEGVRSALEQAKDFLAAPDNFDVFMRQHLAEMDRNSEIETGRQEGREEGRKEGREEGRQEGRQEGRREGRKEGRQEGRQEEREKNILALLKNNAPLSLIAASFGISEDTVRSIGSRAGFAF